MDESKCKPNKIWVDKGSKFHNSSFKLWLQDNDIEIYSTHNELHIAHGQIVEREGGISSASFYSCLTISQTWLPCPPSR